MANVWTTGRLLRGFLWIIANFQGSGHSSRTDAKSGRYSIGQTLWSVNPSSSMPVSACQVQASTDQEANSKVVEMVLKPMKASA